MNINLEQQELLLIYESVYSFRENAKIDLPHLKPFSQEHMECTATIAMATQFLQKFKPLLPSHIAKQYDI